MATSDSYTRLNPEDQADFADKIIVMLLARVHKDETTDPTGFTITKRKLGEHAGTVIRDVRRGALQPIKFKAKKFV